MKYLIALTERFQSNKIAVTALGLWCLSLTLPSIYPYEYSGDPFWGIGILLLGWMLLTAGMAPWLPNLFFLYAALGLIFGKNQKEIPSVIAFAISFEVIRFTYLPTIAYSAIGLSNNFKYGPGAFIWLLSIYLLMVASGVRNHELGLYKGNISKMTSLHALGIYAIIIFIVGTIIFKAHEFL
jgi:hypothetical protein